MNIAVVMNPRAGGGRMAAEWPAIGAMLKSQVGPFELMPTSRPGETPQVAQRAAEQGADLVIAAGGDGTIGEVADGLLRASRRPQIGIIPMGTGVDFPRSVGLRRPPAEAIAAIASERSLIIDAGRMAFVADDGSRGMKHFINVASAGLSGPTARAVNAAQRRGASGRLTFLFHTIAQLMRYRPKDVRIRFDDSDEIESSIAVVAVCNGRYFGAGLMVAPDAQVDDGLLDIVVVAAAGKLELIQTLQASYTGQHRKSRLCTFRRARTVTIEPRREEALIEIDGEVPGRLPARAEILPGALTLRG